MIDVRGLHARVGEFSLTDITFTVGRGQYGVVIGAAGSGKTTLLESLAGVVPIHAGQVHIGERDVTAMPTPDRGIGLVYQHGYLFPHLTVAGNVAYGAVNDETVRQVTAGLGVDALSSRRVQSLSGGERQLVALARALARRPAVLLLDEPFSALDPRRRSHTRRFVRDLHRTWGTTVLQVTHDFAEAGLLGEVTVLLDAGRVLQYGPSTEVFRRPASPYIAEFLGAENVLSGRVVGALGGGGPREVDFLADPLRLRAVSDIPEGPAHAVIRAEEVVLSLQAPGSSARNVLSGNVTDVASYGPHVRVTLDVQGVPLVALLTVPSLQDLGLSPGSSVFASFKAFAVHLC